MATMNEAHTVPANEGDGRDQASAILAEELAEFASRLVRRAESIPLRGRLILQVLAEGLISDHVRLLEDVRSGNAA